MTLSQEQTEQFIAHLQRIIPSGVVCPVCGQRRWHVNRLFVETREFENGNLMLGGPTRIIPYVSISCDNCGNALFFNAIQLGLLNRQTEAVQQNNEQSNNQ